MGVQFIPSIKIVFLLLAFETLPFPKLALKSALHRAVGQMILFACWFVICWIGVEREQQARRQVLGAPARRGTGPGENREPEPGAQNAQLSCLVCGTGA